MDFGDPLDLARRAGGALLLIATLVALVLWLAGLGPRMLTLVGFLWAFYGFYYAVMDGLLVPFVDGVTGLLENAGLRRAAGGLSEIEALVERGEYAAAAEAYRQAASRELRVSALVRRASLLASNLGSPGQAALELEAARQDHKLKPDDELRIGAALAHLYEGPLNDPGRAMTELRRLIDLYPDARNIRRLRRELDELREARFGSR